MPQNPALYSPMPDLDLEGSSPLSMGGGLQIGNIGSNYAAQQGLHRQLPPPPELTAEQLDAMNQQQDRQAWARNSPFLSGVASGWEGLKAGANGLVGAGQAALGFDNAARASLHRRAADAATQKDYDTGSPASLSDVHGVGDAFDWAEHQLGAAVPGMAAVLGTTLATGGVGDLVGLGAGAALRGAGERLGAAAIEREAAGLGIGDAADAAAQAAIRQRAARNVAERAGTTIADDVAPEQVTPMAQQAFADNALPRLKQLNAAVQRSNASPMGSVAAMAKQLPAATLGGAVVSGEGATQDLDPNMSDADLTAASGKALAGALGEGALMALPGLALMRRYGVGAAAEKALSQKMARPMWQRLVAHGAAQGGVMAVTNGAADAANKVLHNWITGDGLTQGLVTPDALSGYLNDLAGGAITGAIMGAPAGLKRGDVALPALGKKARAFRLFQRVGKAQARAAKPGDEVNDDGTPLQPSPVDAANNADANEIFHSRLDALQRTRSQWEQDTFGDTKPFDLTQDDNTGRISIGTSNNVPGAKLFDPAEMADAQQLYPGRQNALNAGLASLLPRGLFGIPGRDPDAAVRATAKAVQSGFDALSAPEQTQVGRYLNLLPEATQTPFKRLLMTVGQLTDDQRRNLDLPGNRSGEGVVAPDAVRSTALDEEGKPVAAPTEAQTDARSSTGIEGGLTERASAQDAMGAVPDLIPADAWRAAQFAGDRASRPSPDEANVVLHTATQGGEPRDVDLNMPQAAAALSASPEGREWLGREGATNRRVDAVLGVMRHAAANGETIDPHSIRAGLRVFPDKDGESGVLSDADIRQLRTQAQAAHLTPQSRVEEGASAARRAMSATDRPQEDLATQAAAAQERATRGEAPGSDDLEDRAPAEGGHGDFDTERDAARTEVGAKQFPGRGAGDVLTAESGKPQPVDPKVVALNARHEATMTRLRRQYAAAKKLGLRDRMQQLRQAANDETVRHEAALTKMEARRDRAEKIRLHEVGSKKNPPATNQNADRARINQLAKTLKVNPPYEGGTKSAIGKFTRTEPGADTERLAQIYEAAKAKPASGARTALLGAIRRVADGNEELTNRLDASDTAHPADNNRAATTSLAKRASKLPDASIKRAVKVLSSNERRTPEQSAWLEALQHEADERGKANAPTARSLERVKQTAEQDAKKFKEPTLDHSKLDTGDSLDRSPDDSRSVAETVAAAKRNPAYQAIRDEIDGARKQNLSASQRQSKVQAVVKRLAKAFHVVAPEVHFFDKGDFIEHKGELVSLSGDVGMLQRQAGKVAILHLRSDLEPHEMVGVMLHEFGHHLQHSLFDALKADDPVKQRIFADFKKWRVSLKGTDTARRIRASRAPFFNTLADLRLGGEGKTLDKMSPKEAADYLTSFSEYFADNMARALSAHGGVQDAVGRFFSHAAHAMKLVYDLFTGRDRALADAPKSFHDFVNQSWYGRSTPPELEARAAHEAANHLKPGDAAAAEGAPNSPGSTPPGKAPPPGEEAGRPAGNDGSRPSDVSHLLNYRDRGLIESLVTRVDVVRKILTEFPQLRDQLMSKATQMDTAVNAAYALWAKGKLQLTGDGRGTGYAGAFRRFADAIMHVFGLKTGAELGERIFDELKNDSYKRLSDSGKLDVGARQRADYLSELRAQQAKAGDAEKAVLNGRIALRRSINYALRTKHTVVDPIVKRALHGLDARMRASNNAAIRQIAVAVNRMTGEIGDQEGMIRAIHRNTNVFANRLDALVGKLTPEEQTQIYHAALMNRALDDPKLEAVRQKLQTEFAPAIERYMRAGMSAGGGRLGHLANFVPLRFNHLAVRENEAKFRAALGEINSDPKLEAAARDYFYQQGLRSGMKAQDAKAKSDAMSGDDMVDAFYRMAQSDPALRRLDPNASDPLMRAGTGAPSGGPSFNPRVMDFLRKAGRPDVMEKLLPMTRTSLHEVYLPYIRSAVHRTEFYRSFVRTDADGKQYSLVDRLLDKAKETGASEADMQLARDYVDAQLGTYGDPNGPRVIQKLLGGIDNMLGSKLAAPDSRTWEKINNALTTYQNIRVLGLGILGNMIDPLGVWTRTSSLATTWQGYAAAAKANWGKSNSTYLRAHAEALGVVERYASNEALSAAFNNSGTPGTLSYKLNHALFHYNGMEMVTRFARLAALASGHKFLLEHARGGSPHSARYLEELGLKPEDIKADTQHPGFVDTSSEKVQKALFQLVDESVVRPHAGQRPLWHADPGMRMVAQYRGFVFSFYDTVMKRMSHEVRNGNLGGVAPVVGYLGVTMAAELAREMIQYGPGGNPERQGWGIGDYTLMAAERSGMLGPRADFMNSAYPELANSHVPIPYESLTGPSVSQADDFISTALGRGSEGKAVLQAAPLESIYHGWVQRPKPENTHQGAAQIAANFADDFVLE